MTPASKSGPTLSRITSLLAFIFGGLLLGVSAVGVLIDYPRVKSKETLPDSQEGVIVTPLLASSRSADPEKGSVGIQPADSETEEQPEAIASSIAPLQQTMDDEMVRIYATAAGLMPSAPAVEEVPLVIEEEPPAPAPESQPAASAPPQAPVAPPPPSPTRVPPTRTPTPPTPVPPPPVTVALSGLEQEMFVAHNNERARAGLAPLVLDSDLVAIARHRANDMATKGYFSHTSPSGETIFTLLSARGIRTTRAAENIASNNAPESQAVAIAMSGFMSSAGHRANILGAYVRIGVGVAQGGDMWYFVVVFTAP